MKLSCGRNEGFIINSESGVECYCFFYRHVLENDIEDQINSVRVRQKRRLPVVLTVKEVNNIFDEMLGLHCLMAKLIYGCGLRLQECLSLRIKDVDIEQGIVIVRSGKGDKDRRTVLPESLKDDLLHHISTVREIEEPHCSPASYAPGRAAEGI